MIKFLILVTLQAYFGNIYSKVYDQHLSKYLKLPFAELFADKFLEITYQYKTRVCLKITSLMPSITSHGT